jgi:hypothetical protein
MRHRACGRRGTGEPFPDEPGCQTGDTQIAQAPSAHHRLDEYREAITCYERAMELSRTGDPDAPAVKAELDAS